MNPLLDAVCAHLDSQGIAHCLIGAMAMSARGYPRASLDIDLMVTDDRVLGSPFWTGLQVGAPDIRPGDSFDPLAGVVTVEQTGALPIDVVVFGPLGWQHEVLIRAQPVATLPPVPELGDLVLLKLFAGGPRDQADIHGLIAVDPTVVHIVSARVVDLPERCQTLWHALSG